TQRAATVAWAAPGGFLQVNASDLGRGHDVAAFPTLQFRVFLGCVNGIPTSCGPAPDPTGDVDFSIALANSDGTLSAPVTLKSVAVVRLPVGFASGGLEQLPLTMVFQTVRIPLSSFTNADLRRFRGVRFTFDRTASSLIALGNVVLTESPAGPGGLQVAAESPAGPGGLQVAAESPAGPGGLQVAAESPAGPGGLQVAAESLQRGAATMPKATPVSENNRIVSIRSASVKTAAGSSLPGMEIEVTSSRPCPVVDALPVL